MAKNRAAQSLGRRGGSRNTPAQQIARRANALKGGRPADFLVLDNGKGALTLQHRDGQPVTHLSTKAVLFVTRWLNQHKPGMFIHIDGGIIRYAKKAQ